MVLLLRTMIMLLLLLLLLRLLLLRLLLRRLARQRNHHGDEPLDNGAVALHGLLRRVG